ncbi:unnamed protein product, partial [Meganyctiphanes norvegica]
AQCACEYKISQQYDIFGIYKDCEAPSDLCGAGLINGMPVYKYCPTHKTEKSCKSSEPWTVPMNCQCHWRAHPFGGGCKAPYGICSTMEVNGTSGREYCSKVTSERGCENLPAWLHPDSNRYQLRHPYWCSMSIGFILGPSIMINLVLLISLLYKLNFRRYFITAGLPALTNIHWVVVCLVLLLMATFQLLPYLCMILKIMSMWRICVNKIEEDENSNALKSITLKMKIFFSFTEDLLQLTLQGIFFLRAVLLKDDGILDDVSWLAVTSLSISCVSLSMNYTEYWKSLHRSTSALMTFSTAFIAASGRIMICCIMAVVFDKLNYIYSIWNSHSSQDSNYEYSNATWRLLLPVSSALVIQIIFSLAQLCYTQCRKSINQSSISPSQNLDEIELREVEMKQINSTNCEIEKIFTHEKTRCQKLLYHACQTVAGCRSLLLSVTVDGHSILGLWSSACYATWALWIRLHFITEYDEWHCFPKEYCNISKTALIFAMLSYTINIILVLIRNHQRKNSLIVSLLFMVYPLYVYIMAASSEKEDWFTGLKLYTSEFDDVIVILNPIIIVASLALLVNITAVVLGIVKGRTTVSE